jgi:hypothetical protein
MAQAKTHNMTDYEAERQHFPLDVPAYFNFAIDILEQHMYEGVSL